MDQISVRAPAKINLALDIKGLQADGYHQLETIMQSVSLCDHIYLKKTNHGIKLTNSVPGLPEDNHNLAYRAAELIFNQYYRNGSIEIHIDKKIPVAAGLAGGSTDAAAVIKGINLLFGLGLDYPQLLELARAIGSDVPFCLKGGTAFAYGRGDQLVQLPDLKKTWLVLVTPPKEVLTAVVYQQYDLIKPELTIPMEDLKRIIKNGQNIYWNEGWNNVLEPVTAGLIGDITEIKEMLKEMGAIFTMMSGSGPTVFGVMPDREQAEQACQKWPRAADSVFPVYTYKQDFKE